MQIPKYIELYRKELERKFFRYMTIKNYINCIEHFLNYFNGNKTEPIKVNEQDIKDYLWRFKEQNTQRAHHSAIKCFYKYVLRQPNKFKYIELFILYIRIIAMFVIKKHEKILWRLQNGNKYISI